MRKRTLCAVVILTVLGMCRMDSQAVVSSAGGDAAGTGGSMNWTIGEPISFTLGSTEGYVTQGFHQPAQSILSPEPIEPIPTLGEWSLVILALLLMTIGAVAVQNAMGLEPE